MSGDTAGDAALVALTAAAWAHAAFQLTVSMLVYPVLAATPHDAWRRAHDRHSRMISVLVVPLYAAVLVSTAAALLLAGSAAVWAAAAGAGLALGTTAAVAAPLHGRLGVRDLGDRRRRVLLARLLHADRWRTVGALVSAGAATLAHW